MTDILKSLCNEGLVPPKHLAEEQETLALLEEEQENSAGVEPTVVLKGGVPRVVRARWELLAGTSVLWARRSHRCGGGGKIDGGGDELTQSHMRWGVEHSYVYLKPDAYR